MATKKNTKVNDSVDEKIKSVDDLVDDSAAVAAASAAANDDFAADVEKVEDNDTPVVQAVTEKPPRIIRVKRVENKDLEATLQQVGYENVAQILVEPSLGFALFNVIYWESED